MLGIGAAGGFMGALVAPSLRTRLTARMALIGENLVLVLVVPLLLIAHNALLIGLILAGTLLITPVTNTIVVGYRVALVPDELQGRVQAASMVVTFSVAWLGPLVVGLLVEAAGLTATILALTGWALGLLAVATLSRAFRHPPELPDPTRSG
jgi:hypothetical protein